jgi:hypothetical protein
MSGLAKFRAVLVAALIIAVCGLALAWWPAGHKIVTTAAVNVLPEDMPKFFRRAGPTLAAYAVDPDVVKNQAVPALAQSEHPRHFIDMELLSGEPVPATRVEFDRLCIKLGTTPDAVGTLPYTIQTEYERLVMAFAEYRKYPRDAAIQAKILYIAGTLSHYTADAVQPLHTTVHFDGRVGTDGKSPRSGIHNRMDALLENCGLKPEEVSSGLKVEAAQDVFSAVMTVIEASSRLVDKVYELEPKLPPAENKTPPAVEKNVRDFAFALARNGAALTATIWYSAWVNSAKVILPGWYDSARKAP